MSLQFMRVLRCLLKKIQFIMCSLSFSIKIFFVVVSSFLEKGGGELQEIRYFFTCFGHVLRLRVRLCCHTKEESEDMNMEARIKRHKYGDMKT